MSLVSPSGLGAVAAENFTIDMVSNVVNVLYLSISESFNVFNSLLVDWPFLCLMTQMPKISSACVIAGMLEFVGNGLFAEVDFLSLLQALNNVNAFQSNIVLLIDLLIMSSLIFKCGLYKICP